MPIELPATGGGVGVGVAAAQAIADRVQALDALALFVEDIEVVVGDEARESDQADGNAQIVALAAVEGRVGDGDQHVLRFAEVRVDAFRAELVVVRDAREKCLLGLAGVAEDVGELFEGVLRKPSSPCAR